MSPRIARFVLVGAVAVASASMSGCHAQLGGELTDSGPVRIDGSAAGSGDAASTPPDAPACANGRVVFLQFGGVTLTKTAASNAVQDRASWIGVTTATVPAYHAGVSGRAAQIQTITDGVRTRLASFPITVVTQRPAAGPYVMVVLGGQNTDVGTNYTYATGEHDCGDAVKNDVGWLSDVVPDAQVPNFVVGTIAWGLGLNGTNDPADCMCGWANGCQQSAGACTLGTAITYTANLACAGLANPQNETAAFSQAFCQ